MTVILVTVFLLVVGIRVQQFRVRKRAELLEKDLRMLEYGKTTYAEVRPLLDRWHAEFGDSNCTNISCDANIEIADFAYLHPRIFPERKPYLNIYGLLGGRPTMIRSRISIRNNVLDYKSYFLNIEVMPRENTGLGYTLIGWVETMKAIRHQYAEKANNRYYVGWPDGCEICVAIYVQFTPQVAAPDLERLGQINFSCVTRWFQPCLTKEDIMPGAWKQALKDNPHVRPI